MVLFAKPANCNGCSVFFLFDLPWFREDKIWTVVAGLNSVIRVVKCYQQGVWFCDKQRIATLNVFRQPSRQNKHAAAPANPWD